MTRHHRDHHEPTTSAERNLRACADAELQGDPVKAWRHYRQIKQFDASLHGERLRLLAELGDEAPGWLCRAG